MKDRKIKNMDDLWDFSETLLVNMENGHVRAADGKEQFNGVGKMIAVATKKLEYENSKRKNKGLKIKFFEKE
jgi:hypothetical protein